MVSCRNQNHVLPRAESFHELPKEKEKFSMSRSIVVALLLMTGVMPGCSDDLSTSTEPGNSSYLYVENATDIAFECHITTILTLPLIEVVPPGESVQIRAGSARSSYTEFNPPSSVLVELELRTVDTGDVLYRQSPVNDDSWESAQLAERLMAFTLVIRESDLDSTP